LKQTTNGGNFGTPTSVRIKSEFPEADDFASMLESTTQQLAGEDRLSRLDAYMTLSGALKATENVPDPKALRDKMGLLTQFIQRDMTAKTATGTADNVLICNALVLLASLIWKGDSLPADFNTYLLDYSAAAFEGQASKEVIKHLLFIIGQQNFPAKIMTPERALRILTAAHDIEKHAKGKSIILGRLSIYKKFLKQSRHVMVTNPDWIKDIFEDMLTSVKEVRYPVISFGIEAAMQLGTESRISRFVMEIFDAPHEKGAYADYLASVMDSSIKRKQDVASIPNMWTVAILFLRSRPKQLEQWKFSKTWFQVLQKCFNSGDLEVRTQANVAWNRFIYAIQPDESTSELLMATLRAPFVGQLRKRTHETHPKEYEITLGGIYNLLYYCLRPGASADQLERYWDNNAVEFVRKIAGLKDPITNDTSNYSHSGLPRALEIMNALLNGSRKQSASAWQKDRAMGNDVMKVDELPLLDAKWIRKNSQKMIDLLQPLLEVDLPALASTDSAAQCLWNGFLASVATAGAKEIKTSNDTMNCIARILGMLDSIWSNHVASQSEAHFSDYMDALEFLISSTVNSLGVLPFTEKKLVGGLQTALTVAPTPTTHPGRAAHRAQSPLHYLLSIFVEKSVSDAQNRSDLTPALRRILSPFFRIRTSPESQIEFCVEIIDILPDSGTAMSTPNSVMNIWYAAVSFVQEVITPTNGLSNHDAKSSLPSPQSNRPLASVYKDLLRLLQYGLLRPISAQALGVLNALQTAIADKIRDEIGDGGLAIACIEPLAEFVLQNQDRLQESSTLQYCQKLLIEAWYPVDARALEAARRKLSGGTAGAVKVASPDPYKHLYELITLVLKTWYLDFQSLWFEPTIMEHLDTLEETIKTCPPTVLVNLLRSVQDGLALWIQDPGLHLNDRTEYNINWARTSTMKVWKTITSRLSRLGTFDSIVLATLEPLLCAAFESRQKGTVSNAISFWNKTLGQLDDLTYPPKLRDTLGRLRNTADILLPSFPASALDEVRTNHSSPIRITDSYSWPQQHRHILNPMRAVWTLILVYQRTADAPHHLTASPLTPNHRRATHQLWHHQVLRELRRLSHLLARTRKQHQRSYHTKIHSWCSSQSSHHLRLLRAPWTRN
jgi:hypothetical protein